MNEKNNIRNRSWMLTIPASDISKEDLEKKLSSYSYIGQQEKGESTGYLHWQIYIENKQPIRFSSLKRKFPTAHLEVRHSSKKSCYEYVTKSKTSIADTQIKNGDIDIKETAAAKVNVEMGVDLLKRGMSLEDILIEYPSLWRSMAYLERVSGIIQKNQFGRSKRPLKVYYLYGAPGTGKTSYVYDKHGFDDVFRVTNYANPFDSYSGEKVLVLDEFYNSIPFDSLLAMLEGMPLELPARYNSKWASYLTVYIISNRRLEDQFEDIALNEPSRMNALYRRISHNCVMKDFKCYVNDSFLDAQVPPEKRQ